MNITITPPKDESAADAAHSPKRQAFQKLWVYPLLALGITVVVELFNHKTFTEGFSSLFEFVTDNPLALLVDALIVLVTLVPALFCAGGCSGASWQPSSGWWPVGSTVSSCSTG